MTCDCEPWMLAEGTIAADCPVHDPRPNAESDAPRLVVAHTVDHLFDLLSALNVSGLHPELPCVSVVNLGGPGKPNVVASPFLATLTEPDAGHVNYIYADENGQSMCVVGCDNCGSYARHDWEPTWPVTVLLAAEPDPERCAEDEIDVWWTA